MKSLEALVEYSKATLSLLEGMQDIISDEDFSNRKEQAIATLKIVTEAIQEDRELREDMLEALEQTVDRVRSVPGCDCRWCERNSDIVKKMRQAIAKAKGSD